MYQLRNDDGKLRTYESTQTGTPVTTELLLTDGHGNKWWGFQDLFTVPFIRKFAANHVVRLYGHGLQIGDLKAYNQELRQLLKSTDPDRVDKAIARTYESDRTVDQLADPLKQCLGLCTVYLLLNDERPDVYVPGEQSLKMSALALDADLQSFFFTWWTGCIERYGKDSWLTSPTASRLQPTPLMS